MNSFDALLIVSFGGPEKRDDVIPFLENVLRGKNVPRERLLKVAEHYYHFGGRSPINDQNRELIAALRREFDSHGMALPIYWGNRNWFPLLPETLQQMRADGVRHAAALATSAFGSYSGCRQYRLDVASAMQSAGIAETELVIEKLPNFHSCPEFVEIMVERVRAAMAELPDAQELIFTAHSIPLTMARTSPYVAQLQQAGERVASACGMKNWALVFQSRSGPPTQPWLEPDVNEYLRARCQAGTRRVIVCPIGFISDHMEVIYDLDTETRAFCQESGIEMVRAGTAGSHPRMAAMVRRMLLEGVSTPLLAHCEPGCCPVPQRPPVPDQVRSRAVQ